MPRELEAATQKSDRRRPGGAERIRNDYVEPPPELRAAIRPWLDLDEVGLRGLWVWLLTMLPLLPPPPPRVASSPEAGLGVSTGSRLEQLAKSLTACAQDRARLNFQAYEYYADNALLSRRVRALEGMIRASGHGDPPRGDADTENAGDRYLPRRPNEGRP
ncbi:MAG: hypothetical protein WA688_08800 [Thermoplasmata archaeon]